MPYLGQCHCPSHRRGTFQGLRKERVHLVSRIACKVLLLEKVVLKLFLARQLGSGVSLPVLNASLPQYPR